MGKILLYPAGRACMSILCNPALYGTNNDRYHTHNYKIVSGAQKTGVQMDKMDNIQIYSGLTSYASADTEEDFSLDLSNAKSYEIRGISNLTYTRGETAQIGGRTLTLQVTNGGADSITVNSLKFSKVVYYSTDSGKGSGEALLWGYFLDSPVTIGVGETKTFAINLDT